MLHWESMRARMKLEAVALSDADLISLAERELGAFASAVEELFGPE
jgi:hypothetical protein